MKSIISPDLIKKYYAGDCSTAEELVVENWLATHPDNTQQALAWLDDFFPDENRAVLDQVLAGKNQVWEITAEKLISENTKERNRNLFRGTKQKNKLVTLRLPNYKLKIGAIFSGVILFFAGYYFQQNQKIAFATAFGEVKQVLLPDKSVVYLNGNSILTYPRNWNKNNREVWLDGEAFFKVKHQENHQKFVVHLSEKLQVEVLGTEFNLSDRASVGQVVLKTGSIKLNVQTNSSKKAVYLRPGDLVEVQKIKTNPKLARHQKVNTDLYSSWTYRKWMLEGTTLQDMLHKLQETYGIKTVVNNKNLLLRRASGSIPLPTGKANLLLQDLAILFGLKITKTNGLVYLDDVPVNN